MKQTALAGMTALLALTACDTLPPRHGAIEVHDRNAQVRVVFSDRDRALIHDYYDRKHKGLPPGLAKKGKLPPGHAMQLERDGRLPPGIAYRQLPDGLDRQLSRLPDGYVRIVLGADIGIMNSRTQVIVDVIKDIASDD